MENGNSNLTPIPTAEDRVKLNVGGKLFETTASTIQSRCPDSLLAALSSRSRHNNGNPIFIDRDPDIFSVLLSLLRSNRLPSRNVFSFQQLHNEALYYGLDSLLRSATCPPPLQGIDASRVATVVPAADAIPSTFTVAGDDGVWIAHGGKISVYDSNLSHAGTVRTHLDEISAVHRVWTETAAVASRSAAGLHFYDLSGGRHVGSVNWTDTADPRMYKARAVTVADSPAGVLTSFECAHRENCIAVVDKSTLQISTVIGRQNGSSAKTAVAAKLWSSPETEQFIGSTVTSSPFGCSGYIRIWDPRSGSVVWETHEPGSGRSSRFGDSFADVDVDVEDMNIFKVCSMSGDVAVADLRKLGEDPWVYLSDKNPSMWNEGNRSYSVLRCYRKQVFVGRDGELEVWSKTEGREGEGMFRRNFVDKEEDPKRGVIRKIEGGGERLFVSRENMEGIEVWESSNFSGATPVW